MAECEQGSYILGESGQEKNNTGEFGQTGDIIYEFKQDNNIMFI
jgi:hypothetical protein